MAINFLNNVDYNQNQLLHARIENQASDALAGTPVDGQLYYNTSATPGLKVGENGAWLFVGGGVESITTANSTFVDLADSGTAAVPVLTASLSASGTPDATVYLRGDNAWEPISAIPGTYTWSIQGDAGGPTVVASGNAIDFAGGTNVTTALSGTTLTINSTDQFVGTLTGIGAGDYIGIDNSTPAVPVVNALASEAATPSKLIARDSSGYGYVVTPASGDSTTKIATTAFVQSSLTGLLEFKGGFDASTGAIVGGGNLTSGGTRVAVAVGDYYVVTVAGDFFGNTATPLTPGDSVIVQTAAAAGASVEGDFIVVQSDTDLATLTTVGIGNVNAGTGISVAYAAGTATVTNTETNTSNTATGTITAGSLSGTVTHAFGINTIVQTINSSGDTVYCDVTRTATTSVATIAVAEATDITILVQKIG
jgi:hypothetical protein